MKVFIPNAFLLLACSKIQVMTGQPTMLVFCPYCFLNQSLMVILN